jgi:iron complex outermembrane receptor protein
VRDNETFSADTYRVVLDYHWTDNLMTYVSYATGFVAGGFSETCGSVSSCAPYKSEKNKNFEVGLKADAMDGMLRMNAAVFNTKYENLQRDTVVTIKDAAGNTFQETRAVNEGESTANGVELELSYVPVESFRVDAFVGWLDHTYDSYEPGINPADLGLTGDPRPFDLSNLDVPYSPEWTAGLTLTYFQDLSGGSSLTYTFNVSYMDEFEHSRRAKSARCSMLTSRGRARARTSRSQPMARTCPTRPTALPRTPWPRCGTSPVTRRRVSWAYSSVTSSDIEP